MLIAKIKLDSTCLLDRHTLNLLAAVVNYKSVCVVYS